MGLSIASIASDGSGRAIPGHLRRDRSRIEKIRPGEHSRARNASLGSADGFPISAAAYESLQKSPAVSFLASFAESTLPTAEGHLGIEGDQIGSYVLGRQLDRGAFSYVVEGWTVESGGIGDEGIRHVAIKVVPKESGGGSPVVAVNASSSFPQLPGSRLSPRQHSPLQHSSSLSSLPDAAARSPAIPIAPPSAPGSQRNPSPLSLAQHRSDPELAQESLDREIAIWQRLRHPNIVRMYEVLDTEHATYIVCELADGGSLYQLLQAHPQGIPERAAWLLFRQIAEGLRYLHEDVAVCHGDLKLENVLLRTSARIEGFRSPGTSTFDHGEHRRRLFCDIGDMAAQTMDRLQVKIGDFGLSEYIGNPAQHHNDGLLAGTLAYMAPELLRRGSSSPAVSPRMLGAAGQERSPILSKAASQPELSSLSPPNASGAQPAVVTGAQDIWAAAVILFALLTGTLPFHDEFAPRLQLRILKGQYDEAALARRQVTLGARELIRRCLQLKEGERLTVRQLVEATWVQSGPSY
ncbi:kinase-like domain-containing protein [Hyaloraphidium curvatum]|nr:kinase-like domain-containing protein [Hyaloraphidium curvatum]